MNRNDLYFIPILKNKANSEPTAINECLDIFSEQIIPYVELVNIDKDNSGYKKTNKSLENYLHFVQVYRKKDTIQETIDQTRKEFGNNVIPSLAITNEDFEDFSNEMLINSFIEEVHSLRYRCSIRIQTSINIDIIRKLIEQLNENDFFIIDIEDNSYKALKFYLNNINNIAHKCKLIIFSDERPLNSTNKDLSSDDYNDSFNISVIDAINDAKFTEDGFGSYCAARNDLTQNGAFKYPVYGVFVLYSFSNNSFFSYKTDEKEHISRVYRYMKIKLKNKREELDNMIKNTAKTQTIINDFLDNDNKKGNASTYISFSIVRYIEEIYQGLFIDTSSKQSISVGKKNRLF